MPDPLNYVTKDRYQFASTTEESLAFGYGEYSCPGRYYATYEIKLILSSILLDYDIKMPNGATERYPRAYVGMFVSPDSTKTVLFKKRI